VTASNLRAYLERDWDLARRIKDERIGRAVHAGGATAAFRLAQLLLDQVWDSARREPRGVDGVLAMKAKLARARA
jgi:hypothetical protein